MWFAAVVDILGTFDAGANFNSSASFFMKLCLIILLFFGWEIQATSYSVTRTDDPTPDGCDPIDCSLREAVIMANANPGIDVIHLGAGSYVLSINGADEDDGYQGDLDVKDDVRIQGVANNLTFLTNTIAASRIFDVKIGVNVTLNDLNLSDVNSITDGAAIKVNEASIALNDVIIVNNIGYMGGGIFARFSEVEINDSLITNNLGTTKGGGVYLFESTMVLNNSYVLGNRSHFGGGIYAEFLQSHQSENVISVNDSLISNNKALDYGGGVYFSSESTSRVHVLIDNSVFWNNQAGIGGGIYQYNAVELNIIASTFYANSADVADASSHSGGAVFVHDAFESTNASLTIENSLFNENSALGSGGVIYTGGDSSLTILNSTFSNNTSASYSVIFHGGAFMHLVHNTVINNSANNGVDLGNLSHTTIEFSNNILSANCSINAISTVNSTGGNIETPGNTCNLGSGANDIVALGHRFLGLNTELGDYGGPTQSHIINQSFSAAVGNAVVVPSVTTDQRYFVRDNQPDSGATEQYPGDIDLIFKNGFQ